MYLFRSSNTLNSTWEYF